MTAVAVGSGAVTPGSQNVASGDFAAVTIGPDAGFAVAGVTTDCGGGTLAGDTSSYTTVAVTADCSIQATFAAGYAVGGDVSGLPDSGPGVTLRLSGGVVSEEISIGNGVFAFAMPVVAGDYAVTVAAQPGGWECAVTPAGVTVVDADATVAVLCLRRLTVDYGIKQVHFSWDGAGDADYFRLYEDADGGGAAAFAVIADNITVTSVTHGITLYQRLNARYYLSACDDAGTSGDIGDDVCTDSAVTGLADHLVAAIGYVKGAAPVAAGGLFGSAVALSDDGATLAVGVPGEAAVYLYVRDAGGTWSRHEHSFTGSAGSAFGSSLALSRAGDVLVVGAPGDTADGGNVSGAGSVFVYSFDGAAWSGPERLFRAAPAAGDGFGFAVALSADGLSLAVGAPGADEARGVVNLYTMGTTWSLQRSFARALPLAGDRFGMAVALGDNGRVLVAGAPAAGAGTADLFTKSGNSWNLAESYVGKGANGKFGSAFALAPNGRTLVVGAPEEDVVFSSEGGDINVSTAGAVYVIAKNGNSWAVTPLRLTRQNPSENARFGAALAYGIGAADILAVGAPGEDGKGARGIDGVGDGSVTVGSGAVYVYTRGGSWTQLADVKAANTEAGDGFGHALALAGDGSTLTVAAPGEDSVYAALCALGMDNDVVTDCAAAQADFNAADAGAVYLY